MLRPAGGGIYVVSTGVAAQAALQRRLYGAASDDEIFDRWRAQLDRVHEARVLVLGVPMDIGAGFTRGAAFGPQAIREALLAREGSPYADPRVIDVGDVLVVPQLLHDEMLGEEQIADTREALYGDPRTPLPVSPLSMAELALRRLRALAPDAATLVLGGDHAVGWPSFAACAEGREERIGILHFDAHTDLLETRLGVKYCFATWAYHANELMGRGGRLAQVGIRISGHDRGHWERSLDVHQHWAHEVDVESADALAERIVEDLRAAGVEGLYISNDIDGTDPRFAAATGTPEPNGLHPDVVLRLIEKVSAAFRVWGSDLVEVAPPVGQLADGEPARTLETAARYVEAQLSSSF